MFVPMFLWAVVHGVISGDDELGTAIACTAFFLAAGVALRVLLVRLTILAKLPQRFCAARRRGVRGCLSKNRVRRRLLANVIEER